MMKSTDFFPGAARLLRGDLPVNNVLGSSAILNMEHELSLSLNTNISGIKLGFLVGFHAKANVCVLH